ncbi:MAG: hypothetical protein ACP5PQ_00540 [Thermoproteota archaeon]
MIRVMGETAPTPPELRLSSIEFNEDEAVAIFTNPGEFVGYSCKLVKNGGSHVEEDVTRGNLVSAR